MGKTKKILLILGLWLCANACFAKQISFQIIQHDDRIQAVSEQSLVVEDELLNGLFETGYIVTNSPTTISQSSSNDLLLYNKAMGDAYEGSSDYFLQITLYYTNDLVKMDWSLASVATGNIIKKSSIAGSDTGKLLAEISDVLSKNKA